jgi:serine phosphatase RsbU (regulator of sigma subunit)/pSer/pThr/pTyr-binding forkhead associated (FHA) protein
MDVAMLSFSDSDGRHSVLLDRSTLSIGRSASQDIVLHDAAVSRQHAMIERDEDGYTVVDRESSHGTFLNGERVTRARLKAGDVLQFGAMEGVKLRFHLQQADQVTLAAGVLGEFLNSLETHRERSGEARPAAAGMQQLNWLLSAARQLNEGAAIDEILGVLLRLTLQLTGLERGFVFLSEEGVIRFAQGLDPEGKIDEEDLTISRRAMQAAIESETSFSVSDTMANDNASAWSSVLANKIRSIYCIPLRKRIAASGPAELLGLLYLDSQVGPGKLTEVDHQLLDRIATEASALLHNALLAEAEHKARQAREELAVAARIHSGLMSIDLPVLPYAQFQARSVPCLAIGGDFYDVVPLDDCVCVTVVDVSGKGVSAAIVAATLQGILHAQLLARQSLPDIAAMVNRFLCARNVGKYATMVMLKLFPDGRVEYMNCGHVQPLVILGQKVRRLEESNMIVGLIANARYSDAYDEIQPGERILLATDGITEAENAAGELFGDEGLSAAAISEDIDAIMEQIAGFQDPNPAQDDYTLLEVRFTGATY